MDNELRFAVLMDADNISDKYVKLFWMRLQIMGVITYKRIYGDWTSPRLASWKNVLLDNSIIPMQQYSYTTGKNSTDSAMIIDAMDILYSGTVDGFCIVSSDSDFTRLAARLRESGMQVIGMGESKTPKPFISACNQFKYLDLLYSNQQEEEKEETRERQIEIKSTEVAPVRQQGRIGRKRIFGGFGIRSMRLLKSFRMRTAGCSAGNWEISYQSVCRIFDVRNYGFSKLTPFIKSLGDYEVEKISDINGQKQIYFRLKSKKHNK